MKWLYNKHKITYKSSYKKILHCIFNHSKIVFCPGIKFTFIKKIDFDYIVVLIDIQSILPITRCVVK